MYLCRYGIIILTFKVNKETDREGSQPYTSVQPK